MLVGSCPPGWQRLTWHLVQRWAASPPLPGDGSREKECLRRPASLGKWPSLPGRWARPSGWATGCGARWPASTSSPARLGRPLPGAAASSSRCQAAPREVAAWRAGWRASLLGSCLLLPPPSGSDIIPLSPRRSRSTDSGKQEKDGERRAAWRGVRGVGVWDCRRLGLQSCVCDKWLTATAPV